jgi:hypothetical protein
VQYCVHVCCSGSRSSEAAEARRALAAIATSYLSTQGRVLLPGLVVSSGEEMTGTDSSATMIVPCPLMPLQCVPVMPDMPGLCCAAWLSMTVCLAAIKHMILTDRGVELGGSPDL